MGYGYDCDFFKDFECELKQRCTGSCAIPYGSKLYEDHCKSPYKIDPDNPNKGYEACPYFKEIFGCHIVTAICKKLFSNKQVPELGVAYAFRKRLEKDSNMKELVTKYNIVGPILARIVENDEKLARNIYINTIVPAVTLLYKGEDNKALALYMRMVRNLIEKVKEPLQNSINATNPYLVINHQIQSEIVDSKKENIKKIKR